MTTIKLLEKIKIQVCNNVKQYRLKAGYPDELTTNQQLLNLITPIIQPPYDEIKYSIELSAVEVKQLLNVLEEYPNLKSERDSLWKAQTDTVKQWNKAIKILKDTSLTPPKRNSKVLHEFGLIIEGKKRSKFNKRQIKNDYYQLVEGYDCADKLKHIEPISKSEAIIYLTEKYKFASINACNQYLKALGIKKLSSTWETDGILK